MRLMLAGVGSAFLLLRPWVGWRAGAAMDLAVVLVAWQAGALEGVGLASAAWPLSLVAGVLLFALSVCTTTAHWKRYFRRPVVFRRRSTWVFARVALLAPVHEELVWRVCLQSLLLPWLGVWTAVAATGIGFTVWHRFAYVGQRRLLEFLAFSWVLGACYAVFRDPVMVVVIHAVRNLLVFSTWEVEA